MSTTKMRPIRETIPLEEALALMTDAVTPVVRTERLALHDANGRVLARDVASERDVPPFDRAAMDGLCRGGRGHVRRRALPAARLAMH